ncbi:hypothetical protein RB195_022749 [Necator americanus]|uniref:Uncharacterized protein n=1 Tax=Necator americanus TaxID=51031 RepID=A0ABR1EGG6_NECAM
METVEDQRCSSTKKPRIKKKATHNEPFDDNRLYKGREHLAQFYEIENTCKILGCSESICRNTAKFQNNATFHYFIIRRNNQHRQPSANVSQDHGFLWRRIPATRKRGKPEGHFRGGHDYRSASLPGDAEAIGRGGSRSGPGPWSTVVAVGLPIRAPEFSGKFLRDVRVRVIVQQANLIELRVLLADLVGQSLQLSAVNLGSNCRVVRQQFETVDSMNSLPEALHDLLLMDFTFHERIRHFIASAPGTFVGVVDVRDPFFISSDNGVQPLESAVYGEQLSADVQASLAVASLSACGSH